MSEILCSKINDGAETECAKRASRLRKMLRADFNWDQDDYGTAVIDMLADAWHLAHAEGLNMHDMLDTAFIHYETERDDEKTSAQGYCP